jgi:HEAT repeat protein
MGSLEKEKPDLIRLKSEGAYYGLIEALRNPNADIRVGAINALGELKEPRSLVPLEALLSDEDAYVREKAIQVIWDIIKIRLNRIGLKPNIQPSGSIEDVRSKYFVNIEKMDIELRLLSMIIALQYSDKDRFVKEKSHDIWNLFNDYLEMLGEVNRNRVFELIKTQ